MYRFGNGIGRSCVGWFGALNVGGVPIGGIIMGLLFLAAIAAVVYVLIRKKDASAGAPSAEDIVKKRFARGEIGREEYQTLLKDLRD